MMMMIYIVSMYGSMSGCVACMSDSMCVCVCVCVCKYPE